VAGSPSRCCAPGPGPLPPQGTTRSAQKKTNNFIVKNVLSVSDPGQYPDLFRDPDPDLGELKVAPKNE